MTAILTIDGLVFPLSDAYDIQFVGQKAILRFHGRPVTSSWSISLVDIQSASGRL